MKYDVIIVGAGFAGVTAAQILSSKNKKVLIIDERDHIGGNAYDEKMDNILVHKYGPHIFHTSSKEVYDYLSNFTSWYPYKHRVLGHIEDKLVPIPFNFKAIDELFKDKAEYLKNLLIDNFGEDKKIPIFSLLESDNDDLKELGEYIFENVFKYYTMKQWGLKAEELDKEVIKRVPVVSSYEDGYFKDEYQFMPSDGYTKIFEKMLANENIELLLNTKSEDVLKLSEDKIFYQGSLFEGHLIYTGSIDRLFDYAFGTLAYRSLDLDLKKVEGTYQVAATENYPYPYEVVPYTRITEYKHFTNSFNEYSYIHIEYPKAYDKDNNDIPYYPILTEDDKALYDMYLKLVNNYPNLILLGRLAEYKYYNMDAIVSRAIEVSNKL